MEIIKNFSIYGATPRAPGFARFRHPAPCRAAHAGDSPGSGIPVLRDPFRSCCGRSASSGMAAAVRCAPLQSRASSSSGHAPPVFALPAPRPRGGEIPRGHAQTVADAFGQEMPGAAFPHSLKPMEIKTFVFTNSEQKRGPLS